jgi:hypothetical protein
MALIRVTFHDQQRDGKFLGSQSNLLGEFGVYYVKM